MRWFGCGSVSLGNLRVLYVSVVAYLKEFPQRQSAQGRTENFNSSTTKFLVMYHIIPRKNMLNLLRHPSSCWLLR
jgi:hypothetical protein